ncbi:MAG: hypothetical protein IJF83_03185 [Methanobrevibacter sp.]|nr:hypothetical protein [Methanobrevibacter sp.]
MQIFEITQKIPYDCIDGEYLDTDELSLGFVTDEFFAMEFCNAHPDCTYGEVLPVKYANHLKGRMVSGPEDLAVFRLPYKKIYDDY